MEQLRSDMAQEVLDLDCLIERPVSAKSSIGNAVPNYTTISTVKSSVADPSAGLLQQYASKIGSMITFIVKMPYGTDVAENDQLTISGKKLLVQAKLIPKSLAAFTSVLACEVRGHANQQILNTG